VRFSSTSTAIRQIGIADEMMSVPRHSRMKNQSTPTASSTPRIRSVVTIPIAWLMKCDGSNEYCRATPRSLPTPSLIAWSSAFTALTVDSTLAPEARNIWRPSAGFPFW